MWKRLKTIEIRSCPFLDPFRPLAKRLAFDFWWGFSWILTCLPCISVGLSKISTCHLAIGLLCGVENLEMSLNKKSFICEMTTLFEIIKLRQLRQLLCRNLAASSAWTSYLSYHCRWGMGGLLEPEGRKAFHLKLCHLAYNHSWHHHRFASFFGAFSCTSVIAKIHPKSLWIVLLSNKFLCTVQCYMSHAVLPIQSVLQCRHVFPAYLVSFFLGRWSSLDLSVMHRKNFWRESSRCFPCFPLRWSDGTSWAWSICTTMPWWWNVTSLFCISCDERNWWKTRKNPRKTHGKAQDFRVHARSQW